MMYGNTVAPWVLLHGVYGLFCLATGIGILFLIIWAVKHLTTHQLMRVGIALVAIGIIGSLLIRLLVPWQKISSPRQTENAQDDQLRVPGMMWWK